LTILGSLVYIVYKALFITGDHGYRTSHSLSKLLFTLSIILYVVRLPHSTHLVALIVVVLGLIHPGLEWLLATSLLAGLVGFYMGISAYLLSMLGLYQMHLHNVLVIALRTYSISLTGVFVFTTITPIELYNLLLILGLSRASNYPLLVWRLMPQSLRNFLDSISVGGLKKEPATSRVPAAVASVIEMGWFVEEYSYWRLRAKPKTPIHIDRSTKYTVILLASSLLISLLFYVQSIQGPT